ncbi:MAG: lysine biosynthesis enzyme (lysX) [Cenarchaeum symbiont of Oopsacas minuta]|nr:lysine biosynthesis enzyme (lysX) [Cenarchaeum symbiont of Oopsacas minuta]
MTNQKVTVLYDTVRWEEKSLAEAAKRTSVNLHMQDCRSVRLDLDAQPPEYGTILQRCVSYYRNIHSTAAFEGLGSVVINCLKTGIYAGNKLYSHMLLRKHEIPTPKSSVAFSKQSAINAIEEIGYPMVSKPTVGSWGRMVAKISNAESANAILDTHEMLHPIYHIHYLEEFVKRPERDIRAIVVGDRVVAAIYRYSGSGEWKTNMALGGRAEKCPVTSELEEICLKAKKAVYGDIVGVDLMESEDRGLLVHEVNNTTEFKNTVRVCNVDIPKLMIEYAVKVER